MKIIALLVVLLICSVGLGSAATITITIDDVNGINDSTVIQNAVNSSSPGDIIFIESGTYNMSAHTLNYNASNTTIRGNTSSLTKLEWHSAVIFITDNIYNNLTLQNIWLDGDSLGDTNGIYFSGSSDGTIKNVKVTGFSRDGIRLDDSHQCTINNSQITGSGVSNAGLFLVDADNSIISNNVITTGIAHGIDINTGNSNLNINNNTVTGFTGIAGIYLYGGSSSCTVADNIIYGNRDGIRFLTGGGWNVKNNIIRNNNRYGVIIEGQYYTKDATFLNNLIYSNSNDGIISTNVASLQNPYTQTFKNNVIYSNGGNGFQNSHPNITLSLSNNIIMSNSGYGIKQTSGTINSDYNDVWDNTLGSYNGTVTSNNDISSNPLFYDLTNFWLNSTAGTWNGTGWDIMNDYSPCIDAGNISDDYSNEPSPNGSRINMGAYGNTIYASKNASNTNSWWNDSWNYYKTLTPNQTMINQTIGDGIFPMYINITDSDLASKAQADGDDIVFINAANDTQLDHQIIGTFNSTTGHLQARVNVTDISNVSYINMYYNNSGATNTENPSGVWGTNASGIWLMDEGTGLYANDSSGNNNNGTLMNSVAWGSDGLIFDGNNDYVNISENSFPGGANFRTILTKFKTTDSTNAGRIIFSYGTASLTNAIYVTMPTDTDSGMPVNDSMGISQYGDSVGTTIAVNDGIWHEVAVIFNGTTYFIYLDGVLNNSKAMTTNTIKSGVASIGSSMAGDSAYYSGTINSVCIYNCTLSVEEIATRYNNTNSPELFISVGSEQSKAAEATTIETFVVAVGAFATVVVAGAAVVSRRVRRGISGFWNRRVRRR